MPADGPTASQVAGDGLAPGREALARNAWQEAYEQLGAADRSGELSAEDLEGLAQAAWWTGRLEECIAARERAYAKYVDRGERRRAAMVAVNLAKDYYAKLASSVGSAWVSRAERLLEQEGDCIERGYLARLKGVIALEGMGDAERALELASETLETAQRFADPELQAVALHDQGRALVNEGRVAEGLPLLDEATVAAVSGELGPMATAIVYCNMITTCAEIGDHRRAADWTEAAKRWCDRQAIAGFPGMCRVHRASIMHLRGAWPEAEQEARRACEELREFNLSAAAEAFYEVGELRLQVGDLPAAEEAFARAHELGRDPQPGLALVRLAEGKLQAAVTCIERALADEDHEVARAKLLPTQIDLALASGDGATARQATEELEGVAGTYRTTTLQAHAERARGALLLAEGEASPAARSLRAALRMWREVDAPYDAAQTRVMLAEAYRAGGDEESAVLELRAAQSAFEELGARPDARRVDELLGSAGAAAGRAAQTTKTFMFTDVVSSTELVQAIGDDAWHDLIRWHDQVLRSLFAEHGGQEVEHPGDGFLVTFEQPSGALECAVGIQRTLARHRREHGFAPRVRIGLHSAEATRSAGSYWGRGVHEAARIGALAEGGEILASEGTAAAARSRFGVSAPRTVALKGISEPAKVVSVDWG